MKAPWCLPVPASPPFILCSSTSPKKLLCQILQLSLQQRNWTSSWCLTLPFLDALYWDFSRSLATTVARVAFEYVKTLMIPCHGEGVDVSVKFSINLSELAQHFIPWVEFPFLVCAYFLIHSVGKGSRFNFSDLALGVVKRLPWFCVINWQEGGYYSRKELPLWAFLMLWIILAWKLDWSETAKEGFWVWHLSCQAYIVCYPPFIPLSRPFSK